MALMKKNPVFLIFLLLSIRVNAMDYVGHRGASYLAPENTLASVKLAWELGADTVEVDVFLSEDEKVVVIHDETTGRTAGGVDLVVAETPSAGLRKLDVGSFKGEKYAGEKIPFLSEVLNTIPDGKKMLVEVKCGPEILLYLAKVIHDSGKLGSVVVMAFDFEVARGAKNVMPQVPVYWLVDADERSDGRGYKAHDKGIIARAKSKGMDGLGLHRGGVTRELAERIRKEGLDLFVWTVNDADEARRLMGYGIDGLITDRPGWMRKQLSR
jgi:glycerophosphoryl diester phosphodiesterase